MHKKIVKKEPNHHLQSESCMYSIPGVRSTTVSVNTRLPVITCSLMVFSVLNGVSLLTWLTYFYGIVNYCKAFN